MKRNVVRFALTGFVGAWVAGCSADSTRFAEGNPFSNPFSTASNTPAPTPRVAAAPLASASHANPDSVAAARPSPVASASLAPPATGQIHDPVGGSAAGWTAVGGSPIIVAQGDDLDGLSRRYGVPAAALLEANGLHSSSEVRAGARLVVPVYNASAKVAAADAHPSRSKRDEVAEADAPKVKKTDKKSAKAKKATEDADASDDDARAKPKAKKKQSEAAESGSHDGAKADKSKTAAADPAPAKSGKSAVTLLAETDAGAKGAKKKPDMTPNGAVAPTAPAAPATSQQADAAGAAPEFRWPARGRIIQGFKSGGNDGINIAVPEGTSVRAAEDGKVAYAGSALKGYGNLVLIRHPNGFVTAYANNAELDVKNGDTVKRGQVIAKSGQSGDVSSPQLHFELRKGSTPVDPTSYLAGL